MSRRLSAAVIGLALFATPAVAEQNAAPLELVDLTPAFARVWDQTASLPDAERVEVLKADFAALLPGFYDHRRVGAPPEKYDARVLRNLKTYPAQRPGIERVSAEFVEMFEPARASFERRFGVMRGYPPVYLVNSFGEFDGGTRTIAGRTTLLFGADMIDRFHAGQNVQPFFHHELFHLRHSRNFKECEQLWCALWAEGLAVLAAAELNPGATDPELLLSQPEPIRAAVERDRTTAVCEVAARLDSTSAHDQEALLGFRRLKPTLPPRFGYYVGYLAAAEARGDLTLDELSDLDNTSARQVLERSLRKLAPCANGPEDSQVASPGADTRPRAKPTT